MVASTTFLWLEITGKCPLTCVHCYASSGPQETHGDMREEDWKRVIDEGAAAGVRRVQFVGGEPTTHPSLIDLIDHARTRGVEVEVFSNLLAISHEMWETLAQPGVRLATSYYSGKEEEHQKITKLPRSHGKTRANIAQAVELRIPIRVGIIEMLPDQDVSGAYRDLLIAGVHIDWIRRDRLRQVGRGIREEEASVDQLCGQCGSGKVAILPDGSVYACVFSRWMDPVGNVLRQPLQTVLAGEPLQAVRAELAQAFQTRRGHGQGVMKPRLSCGPSGNGECAPNTGGDCCPWN